jgi:hypothetical protein
MVILGATAEISIGYYHTAALLLVIFFPQISTWIPNAVFKNP